MGQSFEDAKLYQEHEAEAHRKGAKFGNYGKVSGPGEIYSKTSAGHLESWISSSGQILHRWTLY
jgi:hypothetical protein